MSNSDKELLLITLEQLERKFNFNNGEFNADVSYKDKTISCTTEDDTITISKNMNCFVCKLEKRHNYDRNNLTVELPLGWYVFSKEYRLFNRLFERVYKYTIDRERLKKSSNYAKAICTVFPDILEDHLLPEEVQKSIKNKSD